MPTEFVINPHSTAYGIAQQKYALSSECSQILKLEVAEGFGSDDVTVELYIDGEFHSRAQTSQNTEDTVQVAVGGKLLAPAGKKWLFLPCKVRELGLSSFIVIR